MKFDELDSKMRIYETSSDACVLPEVYIVARIDGRSFTRLTKTVCRFESPYDERFRDLMVATVKSLMTCGFGVQYGYTQSDEISLLLHIADNAFGRKLRKINSVLAGQASAYFSVALGQPASFDCRVSQLPNAVLVRDYFRWRSEDAARNALNSHCYWSLRKTGMSANQATRKMVGLTAAGKHELLFQQFGVNFNDLPAWQKRGVGLYWEEYEKPCIDVRTNRPTTAIRRRIRAAFDLPCRQAYAEFVERLTCKNLERLSI